MKWYRDLKVGLIIPETKFLKFKIENIKTSFSQTEKSRYFYICNYQIRKALSKQKLIQWSLSILFDLLFCFLILFLSLLDCFPLPEVWLVERRSGLRMGHESLPHQIQMHWLSLHRAKRPSTEKQEFNVACQICFHRNLKYINIFYCIENPLQVFTKWHYFTNMFALKKDQLHQT